MIAVFRRELGNYFRTPIGYVFLAVFSLMSALVFVYISLAEGVVDMAGYFWGMSLTVLVVPVICMRLIAEERRHKTDQLLLTAPVSVGRIVVGKYLAAVALFFAALLLTLPCAMLMVEFGELDLGKVLVQYFGFFLFGCGFIALGLYVSSLTDNPVTAMLMGVGAFVFVLFFADTMVETFMNPWVAGAVKLFTLPDKYGSFLVGWLNPADVSYFVCFSGIFVFLTVGRLAPGRYSLYSRLNTASVVAGVVLINLVIGGLTDRYGTGVDERLLSPFVPPPMTVTEEQAGLALFITLIPPIAVIISGIIICNRRKYA